MNVKPVNRIDVALFHFIYFMNDDGEYEDIGLDEYRSLKAARKDAVRIGAEQGVDVFILSCHHKIKGTGRRIVDNFGNVVVSRARLHFADGNH